MTDGYLLIEGARQNNLQNINIRLPLNRLIVITGVSGSGKSSLAFDTIYAEGQRRYMETFSPYTRQFLGRMDKPQADRIEGIPPAIAIDQTNPVRTSRSTVGTMTELNDHLKLLFARAARLYCRQCGEPVQCDTPESVWQDITSKLIDSAGTTNGKGVKVIITFPVTIPDNFTEEEVKSFLLKEGYQNIFRKTAGSLEVIQDRLVLATRHKARFIEDLEAAFRHGHGRVSIHPLNEQLLTDTVYKYSSGLHCAVCDIHYNDAFPNLFSFNSPLGACETCKGFGRVIDVDPNLVIPDITKTLAGGAIKPWQSPSYNECQDELLAFARKRHIPVNIAWQDLSPEQQQWVWEGEGNWEDGLWYGVKRFFRWLESKSYKMHIRVLLSRYRTYRLCPVCQGARLKPDALAWRLGPEQGLHIHELMLRPISQCYDFFCRLELPSPLDEATELLLGEIRTRLRYLTEVGLGYLSLDRQSRTLSGGEVQRINLTTALGTSLVNTLFVLDEPSIGLHSRDIRQLIAILHRLRDAGNTLVVVEHDPELIRAADYVLDLGPGAGEHGGHVVFFGTQAEILTHTGSLTAQYLRGEKKVFLPQASATGPAGSAGSSSNRNAHKKTSSFLEIRGAAAHNLKNLDVRLPLQKLVCVTGVSGSGKSTLIEDICYRAMLRYFHKATEEPGKHKMLQGAGQFSDVVLVDQSPIGKTTRSNPASYVGAFSAIRELFSEQPLARERSYKPGTFSFNSGQGRCPTCNGSGFEHVEMQFLSDVYLRCPDCDGKRYRPDVLEVKLLPPSGVKDAVVNKSQNTPHRHTASIADVLEMTISEACDFFTGQKTILQGLEPLLAVGLGYIRLGQPVSSLSGGEAQRLKLAGYLVESRRATTDKILFLFDEPTTGLHFQDITVLLTALQQLLAAGHSVIVIEHNLDVIAAANWIIDLGPEGGAAGGELVVAGTPDAVMACTTSHTGQALIRYKTLMRKTEILPAVLTPSALENAKNQEILIRHAREHNLKNLDITIPRDSFTVITGVSGSGKSTLAFDILFAEGQRRYLESLNAYARQFVQPVTRPDIDSISGVPPTVAIEQRTSRGGRKSTVATLTEIYHFLRLLFTKLGTQYCPDCRLPIQTQSREAILAKILQSHTGKTIQLLAPLVISRKGLYTDLAKWALKKGFSRLRVDGEWLPTDQWPRLDRYKEHSIELPAGEIKVSSRRVAELTALLSQALEIGNGSAYVVFEPENGSPATQAETELYSSKRVCPRCQKSFDEPDPRLFSFNSRHGWCVECFGTGLKIAGFDAEQTGEEIWWNDWWEGQEQACPACRGLRLNPQALAVRFNEKTIADLTALSIGSALKYFKGLKLVKREKAIARDIMVELTTRLAFLQEVGLGYLSLDRAAPTLSGGEAQRIRLAAQLGSNLRGVCYILDEPTIGLHTFDHRLLLNSLRRLATKGNTVVVVEHDEETIREAEYIIDLGPGGGVNGGYQVYAGSIAGLIQDETSLTGQLLRAPLQHPFVRSNRAASRAELVISGATLHNLKNINVKIPLHKLVCVTGISGSGKSTLVRNIIHENLKQLISGRKKKTGAAQRKKPSSKNHMDASTFYGCQSLTGYEELERILEVDQTPIGKTPRSCTATYIGIWDEIRTLYAAVPEAKLRGYTASRFSFNTAAGRCPECEGQGRKKIEMSFLPDVTVLCDVCRGNRFTSETLDVLYKGKSIADILHMSVEEAVDFFAAHPKIHHALQLLKEVGLGYLSLGQSSPSFSGGEAQRIKLVTELAKVNPHAPAKKRMRTETPREQTLYILDEPTIGLHMADVARLIRVLHRLVDSGHSVLVIEHNLDLVAEADWIIDLGPGGGEQGGRLLLSGPPEKVLKTKRPSPTAQALQEFLQDRWCPEARLQVKAAT